MSKKITIEIDHKKIVVEAGQTILEVAEENGIKIPKLCYHPDLEIKPNCRLCLVEIKGEQKLKMSCSTEIQPDMEVLTNSPKIHRARKFNLELLFSQHKQKCPRCVWRYACRLRNLAREYNVKTTRFSNRKANRKTYQFGPIIFDSKKCIDCRNCVEICPVEYLEIKGRGPGIEVCPSKNIKKDCIYCGQCIVHCPVGTIETETKCEKILANKKDKILIAQIAPSVRATIGEHFGFEPGKDTIGRITAGLRKIGFDLVFDTSTGADLTTIEEAAELVERIKNKKNLPMFTSCCPAWVKFLEFYYPEFIPNLTTARSPQMMLGGIVKSYLVKKEKKIFKKMLIVSVMPCTAKKFEIQRPEMKFKNFAAVDYVMTTRELIYLFKKHHIDLKTIESEKKDCPFGDFSGAGVIYGASGGVMESALRTAAHVLTGGKFKKIDFKKVRGVEGIKKAKIKIAGKKIKVVVVNGIKNAKIILEELEKNPKAYDYVEFMACPGGCIGGGGQPMPVSDVIRKKRAAGLYQIDKKRSIRTAHDNPIIKNIYQEFSKKEIHYLCHTRYLPKLKGRIKILK